jgi:hypothetical protein
MLSAETAVLLAPAAGVGFYQAEALGRTSRLGWVERRITGFLEKSASVLNLIAAVSPPPSSNSTVAALDLGNRGCSGKCRDLNLRGSHQRPCCKARLVEEPSDMHRSP